MFALQFPIHTPLTFASAGLFVASDHPLHPTRVLDTAVLLLGITGVYPIMQDGREYHLEPNTFMLLFPQHIHGGTHPASDKQSHFWCHFYLPMQMICTSNTAVTCSDTEYVLPEFGYIQKAEKFRLLFRQLIDASQNKYPSPASREYICNAYTTIIIHELCQEWMRQNGNTAPSGITSSGIVEKVREYIRLHACTEKISIAELAARHHYHAGYLSEIFHKETGMTIISCIQNTRIEEAKKLLLTSDAHVDTIAQLSGFGDPKYFMKVFKKHTNVTPTEYRYAYYHIHENNH